MSVDIMLQPFQSKKKYERYKMHCMWTAYHDYRDKAEYVTKQPIRQFYCQE